LQSEASWSVWRHREIQKGKDRPDTTGDTHLGMGGTSKHSFDHSVVFEDDVELVDRLKASDLIREFRRVRRDAPRVHTVLRMVVILNQALSVLTRHHDEEVVLGDQHIRRQQFPGHQRILVGVSPEIPKRDTDLLLVNELRTLNDEQDRAHGINLVQERPCDGQ